MSHRFIETPQKYGHILTKAYLKCGHQREIATDCCSFQEWGSTCDCPWDKIVRVNDYCGLCVDQNKCGRKPETDLKMVRDKEKAELVKIEKGFAKPIEGNNVEHDEDSGGVKLCYVGDKAYAMGENVEDKKLEDKKVTEDSWGGWPPGIIWDMIRD